MKKRIIRKILNCTEQKLSIDDFKNLQKNDLFLTMFYDLNKIKLINCSDLLPNKWFDLTKITPIDTDFIAIDELVRDIVKVLNKDKNINMVYYPCEKIAVFLLGKWIEKINPKIWDNILIVFEKI